MNDEELEARLARWQPTDAPPELLRSLRAAAPATARGAARGWSWPLAYAGLAAAWGVILTLWLSTPHAEPTSAASTAQVDAVPVDTPAFTSALAMERSLLLHNNPDQL